MIKTTPRFARVISALVISTGMLSAGTAFANDDLIAKGKEVAWDRKKRQLSRLSHDG